MCRNAACETPKLQCFLYKSGLIDQSSQQLFAGDHSNWKQSQRIETRAVTIKTTKSDQFSLPHNQNGIENSSGILFESEFALAVGVSFAADTKTKKNIVNSPVQSAYPYLSCELDGMYARNAYRELSFSGQFVVATGSWAEKTLHH